MRDKHAEGSNQLYLRHPELAEQRPAFEKGNILHQQGRIMLQALEDEVQPRLWTSTETKARTT